MDRREEMILELISKVAFSLSVWYFMGDDSALRRMCYGQNFAFYFIR